MGIIIANRYFSEESGRDKAHVRGEVIRGGIGGALGGSLLGYAGGRIAGKFAIPDKDIFIEKYLRDHPKSTRIDAIESYNKKRSAYSRNGALIGAAGGALIGGAQSYQDSEDYVHARKEREKREEMRKLGNLMRTGHYY